MCLMHSETKHTEMLEWIKERLMAGPSKEKGWLTLRKTLNSLMVFQEKFLIGKIQGKDCRDVTFF